MTATIPRLPGAREPRPPVRHHHTPHLIELPLGTRRTLLALLASALGVIPLKSLFSDYGWLIDVWLSAIVVIAPAALLRLRRPPGALDIWPGLILLVPWLTLRFVPQHAFGGLIPTARTWSDVSALLTALHHTTRSEVAPIHTTVAVRMVVCALVGLFAALVDLIAVVGRRGALAGVPLLVIYTVAGAVPRQPVSWIWFAFAALGFLLLLGLDSGEDLQRWGRRINAGGGRRQTALQVSTPRIAVAAILVAVLVPLIVPSQSRNLIANAFHDSGTGVGGFGAGSNGSIAPFAALKGELDRSAPLTLATIHMSSHTSTQPYNMRVNVLEDYTGTGWGVGDHGSTQDVDETLFPTLPHDLGGAAPTSTQTATISLSKLTGNAPVFAVPTQIAGLSDGTTWSPQDQVLLGTHATSGERYTENFRQPTPTVGELDAATGRPSASLAPLLSLPSNVPSYVRDLEKQLTQNETTPYEKARALNDYFTDGKNGFVYDLKTKPGDSGSVLEDFLKNKHGFCQQYAAALGVLLRLAGIPSRIVLGYMHEPPDKHGNFTITTNDAHAWVEAYFSGVGWVPFDPTPASGLVGGSKTDLPWAPHDYPSQVSAQQSNAGPHATGGTKPSAQSSAPAPQAPAVSRKHNAAAAAGSGPGWWWVPIGIVVLALLALPFVPAAARVRRRRRRFQTGRQDSEAMPDALWAELSDTAVDLGYVWSPARSPRQVATWLAGDAGDTAQSLQVLADAVERSRYSPPAAGGDAAVSPELPARLREVTGELRSRRTVGARLRARLWPASLGWGARLADALRRSPMR